MDMIFDNEICIVTDKKTGDIIIAERLTARVETGQDIVKYKDIKDIPVKVIEKLPILKSDKIQEVNKLYIVDEGIVIKEAVIKEIVIRNIKI